MGFDNYLSGMPAPGEQMIPGMGGLEAALNQNRQMATQQQPQQQPRGPHGLGHILGLIGATLATARGRPAPYFEQLMQLKQQAQQQQQNEAFANYLGSMDPELVGLVKGGVPLGAAIQAYGIKHPKEKPADIPSAVREWEYYHGLPDDQRGEYRRFRSISRPQIIGSPTTGYSVYDPEAEGGDAPQSDVPTVNSQEEYDALPPGARYRDSQGNPGVKRGGQTATPSANFPGQ